MDKQIREKKIKSYVIKEFINKFSKIDLKNEEKEEKNKFYFKNIITKLSKIDYNKETIENRKEKCLEEYDNLNEKQTDQITFDVYNRIINNSKPWNCFKEYLLTESKDNNEHLHINNYEQENLDDKLINDIYVKNKEYIDDYINKNMDYYVNMGYSNSDNVIRYVSNYNSIPFNCDTSGVLYSGTKYNEGNINSFTKIPYGYWYKINKYKDRRFENTEFEKDILFYGNLNLPFEYFDSVYSQSQRYFDENNWDKIIDNYEKQIEESKKLIESKNKIKEEMDNYDDYNSDYDDVYLDPKLYGTTGLDDEDCYYDLYNSNLYDASDSD